MARLGQRDRIILREAVRDCRRRAERLNLDLNAVASQATLPQRVGAGRQADRRKVR